VVEEKIKTAMEVVKNTFSKAKNPFVIFTGGKDSLTTLHLVRRVSTNPVNVLFIDTSAHFNEIYLFIEKMRRLWGFNLIKEKNEEALKGLKIAEDKTECCLQLKGIALKNSIEKYGIDYLFTGFRGEGEEACRNEEYIFPGEDCIRINPIVHFTEKEVWEYIKKNNLPYCSLYDKGYSTVDCMPCTIPTEGPDECSARLKDKELVINKLRSLGYF